MKRIIFSLFLFFLISNSVFSQCGTCAIPDCNNMIRKTGPTADADLKTALNYTTALAAPSQAYVLDPTGDPLLGKNGPFTFSACYEIYVTSTSQTVGIAIKPIFITPGPSLSFTGELRTKGQCGTSPIAVSNTVPSDVTGGKSIPSISEWTGLAIGTYVYCINTNVPTGINLKSVLVGSYVKGGVTSNECSSCAVADCKIAGPYPSFADAKVPADHCSKIVNISSSPVEAPTPYISYYKVKTSSSATTLGIIISNQSGNLPGTSTICGAPTRTATLYPIAGCASGGIAGSTTSNPPSLFNREWSGLTPNTEYIIKVETTAQTDCQIEDQCASYYTPGAVTPLPCGTVGLEWKSTPPTSTELSSCADKTFSLRAKSKSAATLNRYIAPGFDIVTTPGNILLDNTFIDEGGSGEQDVYPNSAITYCSPSLVYKLRLKGSVLPGGSGIIKLKDHATGAELYSGNFTDNMVITLPAGTIKGTAKFSGPGVSNYKLDYPNSGDNSFIGSGYGVFNPKTAGNGTHKIKYEWDNGSGPCGFSEIPVTVIGCTTPSCKVVDIDLYDDNQMTTPHSGLTFNCSSNKLFLGPKDVGSTYFNSTAQGDYTWPFPMVRIMVAPVSGNMSNINFNVYDAKTGNLVESSVFGKAGFPLSADTATHYFAKPDGYIFSLTKTTSGSGNYSYKMIDVMSGTVLGTGSFVISGGGESNKTSICKPTNFKGGFTCATCGSGALIQGIGPQFLDEIGIATFDPSKAGTGFHDLIYTWDNELTGSNRCSGTKTIRVNVTGGPAGTATIGDICQGTSPALITIPSASLTGTPTTFSIDWNAAANTAGLRDIVDTTIAASSFKLSKTIIAGTYNGMFSVKNSAGCSSTPVAITIKIKPIPTITGPREICEGKSEIYTCSVLFTSSNTTILSNPILTSGTNYSVEGKAVGTAKLSATIDGCTTDSTVKVNPTLAPVITSKATDATSVTFHWDGVAGLTPTDNYLVEEFILCAAVTCTEPNPIVYGASTGTLTFNSVTSKWEYLKTGLASNEVVYIKVTPIDNSPLAIPSCFKPSIYNLKAIPCVNPVIVKDIDRNPDLTPVKTSFCQGSSAVSATFQLDYNSALNPAIWQVKVLGGTTWADIVANPTDNYDTLLTPGISGISNDKVVLKIKDVKNLNNAKFRVLLKTATSGGSCDQYSKELTLIVKPIPVMLPITSKTFCPSSKVNDPASSTKDFEFKISQTGTPTYTWTSDVQTTGVSATHGSSTVNNFVSFTTAANPSALIESKIKVVPTLDGCVGDTVDFKIKVKPKDKAIFSTIEKTTNSVKFTWSASGTNPDSWKVETAIVNSTSSTAPVNSDYSVVSSNSDLFYLVNSLSSSKKVYIRVTPVNLISNTALLCPIQADTFAIPSPCIKPDLQPLNIPDTVCAGASLDILKGKIKASSVDVDFKWFTSTDSLILGNSLTSGGDYVISDITPNKSTDLKISSKLLMNKSFIRLYATDKATGQCSDTTPAIQILINEIPDATISIFPDPAKLCVGDPKSIEVTFQGSKGLQPYRFDFKLDLDKKDTTSASVPGDGKVLFLFNTNNPIEDSTFILDSITDKNGCTAKFTGKTVKLEVIPLPQLDFQADKTIGCYPLEVIFTDKSAVLNTDVVWDFGNGDLDYSSLGVVKYVFQKSGDYTINFKSTIDGCWDTIQKTNYIRVKDRPEAKFSPKKTNLSLIDPEIQFINSSSSNSIYYKWVFGDGSPVSNLENPKHIYIGDGSNGLPNPGKYTVELYAYINQDCWDSTSTIITIDDEQIYYIPNTFTPNGDEKNNTFQPIFTSGFDAQNYHFLIYNRWGELIFESNNPAIGWDGTYGDKLLGNDSYTWKLQFKEKMTEKEHYLTGHVNLLK